MKINHKKHGKYWKAKNPIAGHVRYAVKEQSEQAPMALLTIESDTDGAIGRPGCAVIDETKCWESMRFARFDGQMFPSLRKTR